MGQEQYRAALASLLPCLTALRLLATRWTAATTWSLLSNLQSDLVSQQVWTRVKPCYHNLLHLVRLLNTCELYKQSFLQDSRVTESELRRVLGILQANGATVHFPAGRAAAVGVYPVQVRVWWWGDRLRWAPFRPSSTTVAVATPSVARTRPATPCWLPPAGTSRQAVRSPPGAAHKHEWLGLE